MFNGLIQFEINWNRSVKFKTKIDSFKSVLESLQT